MKATLFAVVVSLSVASLPTAAIASNKPEPAHTQQAIKKINLNTASVETLARSFKGIGKKRAQAIVAYRQEHGQFRSLTALSSVKGLGKAFVNRHIAELQNVFSIE